MSNEFIGHLEDIPYKGYIIGGQRWLDGEVNRVYSADRNGEFVNIEYEGESVEDCKRWVDEHTIRESARKSKSQPASFSDMVKKQRSKNIKKNEYMAENGDYKDWEVERFKRAREIFFQPYGEIRDQLSYIDSFEHPEVTEILDALWKADFMLYQMSKNEKPKYLD